MSLLKTPTRVLAIVGKELVALLRRPGALISLVLGPFLVMALFGLGYSGYRRPLATIVVIPAGSGLPTDAPSYTSVAGDGLRITAVTPDEDSAMAQLRAQLVDVVVVAPKDIEAKLKQGKRTQVEVRVNQTDPVEGSYSIFLARGLEAAINRQIIETAVSESEDYLIQNGASASDVQRIRPDVISAPAAAVVDNVAPSTPSVVQYFGPAVLALIIQHMAVSLIALSVVRERTSGRFELFGISPITTAELLAGKLIAFALFSALVSIVTIGVLVIGFGVPILANPGWIALVALLLISASLGLGLVIASVSDSEPQAVQLSLLVLLASVFFSGFVIAIDEFSEPIRSLIYALPVASGIRLFGDFMFRGGTVAAWQLELLVGLTAGYVLFAWLVIRRAMQRA